MMRLVGRVAVLGAAALLLLVGAGAAQASTPTAFFNGFETNTAGWSDFGSGTILRQASGYTNGGYASGISSAAGGYHARLGVSGCTTDCAGPYTFWGGSTDTFPAGGWTTKVAIYLDTGWAATHPDVRFDWDVASSDNTGGFLRDFVFNAGTTPSDYAGTPGFVIGASTNATRSGAYPSNPCPDPSAAPNTCRAPVYVTASGWYTFVHHFFNGGSNGLGVEMTILDSSGQPVPGADWTIYGGDPMSSVGGDQYGWFANQEINDLPIDNSQLLACTPTGYYRDGINLTAAQIGGNVTGTLDATGCNIGVYYGPNSTGSVGSGADIFGANYYGVVVNATAANVTGATIHNIGESPFDGTQHGVGVLFTTLNGTGGPSWCNACVSSGSSATGTLSGNAITSYQKNGVVVSGPGASVTVENNTVTGQGPISYIAQNGIEIASGAGALVKGNTVSRNWYTGPTYTACGLLFYQAGGVKQQSNSLFNNQTSLCNAGRGGGNQKP